MTIPLSETPTVGLGQFIKECKFSVPNHQRDYAWKEEYVRQFLDDIETAMENDEQLYFCGLMVFTKNGSSYFHVLDGQQRLATTLIIFSAIRNWLSSYSVYNRAQTQIEERYLGDSDLGREEIDAKLALNSANNDVFRKCVIDKVPLLTIQKELRNCKREDRNRALLEASFYLNTRIKEKAENFKTPDEAKDHFLKLVQFVTETVQIVRLVVRGDEAAYTIFETLNDRGMDLSPLDLVKNYLFSRAEKGRKQNALRDLEERWAEMMTMLSSVKSDSFLRAFWASKHGVPEGKRLFAYFKREYADPTKAYKASLDLRASAERYVAISDSNDPLWSSYSTTARKSVEALAVIGSSQLHPILLAALDTFQTRELERLLRLLEVIAVRYQLVARGRPGRIESLGGRTAKSITDRKITTATQVFSELKELYIPDETFRSDFEVKTERESKKAAYLLRCLEHQSLVRVGDTHPKESGPADVTLEHILPKSLSPWWKQKLSADPDLHNDCLYRLGNLCFLADANRSLGNKSYTDKKKSYMKSKLRLTSGVAKYNDWGRKQIVERQKHLAQLAVSEWRFQ